MNQNDSAEQKTTPTAPPAYSVAHFRQLYRHNSEKLLGLAEDAVLPKNQRQSMKRLSPLGNKPQLQVEVIEIEQPPTTASPVPKEKGWKPECQFPIFMVVVSVVQILLFYQVGKDKLLYVLGYDPHRRHELWRFVTVMFAHSTTSHLWGNVGFQLIVGVLLEMVHYWRRIGIVYVAAVVGGSLLISVISPKNYCVGASAGVYGLLFAHLATVTLNWAEMDKKCCRLFWLLFYITFNIGINSYVKFGLGIETNTSHAGHIGGAVTGFLVSILALKNFEKHPWEKKLQKICSGLLIAIFVIIFIINVSFPSYYLASEWNFDYEQSYYRRVLDIIKNAPGDSVIRRACEADVECKMTLEQFTHNGTIPV